MVGSGRRARAAHAKAGGVHQDKIRCFENDMFQTSGLWPIHN